MTRTTRPAVTILELLVVLALLLILAAVIIPSIDGLHGNDKQKAAADALRSRLADARAKAMETGQPYRVAVAPDGLRIRTGPDVSNFAELPADDPPQFLSRVSDTRVEPATIEVVAEDGEEAPEVDAAGWTTIASFRPDGTCRRDRAVVAVKQGTFPPIRIQVRGVTGTVRTLPRQTASSGATP